MTKAHTSFVKGTAAADRSQLRLLRLIGLFLLLQAFGLVALSIYLITRLDWDGLELSRASWTVEKIEALPTPYLEAIYTSSLFIPLAILIVVAAISFLLSRKNQRGWLLGMLMQGLTLMACLTLYFWSKPFFVYPIMLYGIMMILYLNSYDVRLSFLSKSNPEMEGFNE